MGFDGGESTPSIPSDSRHSGDSVPEATGRNWRPFWTKTVSGKTKQLGMSSSGWQWGVFCISLLKSVFFSCVSLKKSYHLSISISMHCPHESIHLLKLKQKTTTTEDSSILRFVHWIFSRPQQKLSSKAAAQESKNRWALTSLKETWSWSDPKRLPALFHVANDFFWRCDFYLKKNEKNQCCMPFVR